MTKRITGAIALALFTLTLLVPAGAQAGPATPTGTGLAQRVAALEAQAADLPPQNRSMLNERIFGTLSV